VKIVRNEKLQFKLLLINSGCTKKAMDELWKWYDSSEKKGVASF